MLTRSELSSIRSVARATHEIAERLAIRHRTRPLEEEILILRAVRSKLIKDLPKRPGELKK